MISGAHRRVRADATRNAERVAAAARELFAEKGPSASLEEVALRAGVSPATLYRHFPDRGKLLRAVLELAAVQHLSPGIAAATVRSDPMEALVTALEAVLAFADAERALLAAATDADLIFIGASQDTSSVLTGLVEAAQRSGHVRADLVTDDVPRLLLMLLSVLSTAPPGSSGWRRYLRIVLDGLSPLAASPLEPAVPVVLATGREVQR